MADREVRELLSWAEEEGWTISRTAKGHYKLQHPAASRAVIAPGTPSDHRSIANLRSEMRRVLPEVESQISEDDIKPPKRIDRKPIPKRSESSHFDMLPYIQEKIERKQAFASRRGFDVDRTDDVDDKKSLPPHEVKRAWLIALLRIRMNRSDWGGVSAIKRRFRSDSEFIGHAVAQSRSISDEQLKRMRDAFRAGLSETDFKKQSGLTSAPQSRPDMNLRANTQIIAQALNRPDAQEAESPLSDPSEADLNSSDELSKLQKLIADYQVQLGAAEQKISALEAELTQAKIKRNYAEYARDQAETAFNAEKELRRQIERKLKLTGVAVVPSQVGGIQADKPSSQAPSAVTTTVVDVEIGKVVSAAASTEVQISRAANHIDHDLVLKLRERRIALKLSQKYLADKIGVSSPAISLYETGALAMTAARAQQIDDILSAAEAGGTKAVEVSSAANKPTTETSAPAMEAILPSTNETKDKTKSYFEVGEDIPKEAALEIGLRIAKRRQAKSLSQVQLGSKVGVSGQTISMIERGLVNRVHYSIRDIVKALGTTLPSLTKF